MTTFMLLLLLMFLISRDLRSNDESIADNAQNWRTALTFVGIVFIIGCVVFLVLGWTGHIIWEQGSAWPRVE